jgi:hypothetical protein
MPDPRFIIVFAFVLAFLPVDVRAQDYQAVDKTYAQIRQIEDDGSLILENDARIRLWGLEIVNAERMRELLTGQSVLCLFIGKSAGFVVPRGLNHRSPHQSLTKHESETLTH